MAGSWSEDYSNIQSQLAALAGRVQALESKPSPDSVAVPNNYKINTVKREEGGGTIIEERVVSIEGGSEISELTPPEEFTPYEIALQNDSEERIAEIPEINIGPGGGIVLITFAAWFLKGWLGGYMIVRLNLDGGPILFGAFNGRVIETFVCLFDSHGPVIPGIVVTEPWSGGKPGTGSGNDGPEQPNLGGGLAAYVAPEEMAPEGKGSRVTGAPLAVYMPEGVHKLTATYELKEINTKEAPAASLVRDCQLGVFF